MDKIGEMDEIGEICELGELGEFNQLINNCQKICSDADVSTQNLTKISTNITHNVVKDFDELLKGLHLSALDSIKKTGHNTFGEQLIEALDGKSSPLFIHGMLES
jgi:hypothetical protein